MGFVGFFKLAVKCFDVLAWPLFAVVYPLWASVQAIEEDDSSSSNCRKLVAYWVMFSLIFLFEQAFEKLLLWLPFWLYLKLIILCWLVTPNFDGAFYAYKHIVCPCLSMDTEALFSKFNVQTGFFSESSSIFEDQVKRYVEENGPEALEELVDIKLKCRREPNIVQQDVKTAQVTEKIKEVAAIEQVKFGPCSLPEISPMGPDITSTENKKPDTDLISSENAETVGESFEIPVLKQVQKEWTCAICQLTTQKETTLNSHLQGKRHKVACEKLKTHTQQSKNKASAAPEIKEQDTGATKAKIKRARKHKLRDSEEKRDSKCVEFIENLWWCKICNISCTSKGNLDTHLNARKHLARTRELEGVAGAHAQSETTLNSHLQGKRHKATWEELKTQTQQSENNGYIVIYSNKNPQCIMYRSTLHQRLFRKADS